MSQFELLLQIEVRDSPAPWWAKPIALIGLALLVWLGYAVWRSKHDFRITVRGGRVSFHGYFPPAQRTEAEHFLLNDVAAEGPLRVMGKWKPNRVLRIVVKGSVSPGQSQQIRNFMKMTLKG